MRLPIICLHIPKTAGTSFRISAEHYFGPWNVVCDYGEKSPATSEEIRTAFYEKKDFDLLRSKVSQKKFFTGHFSLAKYREHFPESPVVTFFRDPVKRVRNRQACVLSGVNPIDLDFYGITENYEESLLKFNKRYSTNIPLANLNKGNYGKDAHQATDETVPVRRWLRCLDIPVTLVVSETRK